MTANEPAIVRVRDTNNHVIGVYEGPASRAHSWARRFNPDAEKITLSKSCDRSNSND